VTPGVIVLEDSMLAYANGGMGPAPTRSRQAAPARAPAGQRQQDDLK
jgi:hypothetical protein